MDRKFASSTLGSLENVALKAGQRTASIVAYAAQTSDNNSSEEFISAVALYHSGEYEDAIACLQRLLARTGEKSLEHLEILRLLAFCKQANGDLAGAENCALRIQELSDLQGFLAWSGHALVQLAS